MSFSWSAFFFLDADTRLFNDPRVRFIRELSTLHPHFSSFRTVAAMSVRFNKGWKREFSITCSPVTRSPVPMEFLRNVIFDVILGSLLPLLAKIFHYYVTCFFLFYLWIVKETKEPIRHLDSWFFFDIIIFFSLFIDLLFLVHPQPINCYGSCLEIIQTNFTNFIASVSFFFLNDSLNFNFEKNTT